MLANFKPLLGLLNIKLVMTQAKDVMRVDVIMNFKDTEKNPEGLAPFSLTGTPEDLEKALPPLVQAIINNNVNSINNIELISKQLKAKEEAIATSNKKKASKKAEPVKKTEPDLFAEKPKEVVKVNTPPIPNKVVPGQNIAVEAVVSAPIPPVQQEKPIPVVQETPSVKTVEPVIDPQVIEELYKEQEPPQDFQMSTPGETLHVPDTTQHPQGDKSEDWADTIRTEAKDSGSLF